MKSKIWKNTQVFMFFFFFEVDENASKYELFWHEKADTLTGNRASTPFRGPSVDREGPVLSCGLEDHVNPEVRRKDRADTR